MTDLQCPATAVLLAAGAAQPGWLTRLRVAAWFEVEDGRDVAAFLDETADLFRGETFVATASADAVMRALRRRGVQEPVPAVVEIDSDGWHTVPAPGSGGALPPA